MSVDDVAAALNHIDSGHRTTDIYIDKDWQIVDDVQRNVLDLFRVEDAESIEVDNEVREINRMGMRLVGA